jgi:hypothetical protein
MWFRMNKAIGIRTNHATLLVWILNIYCFGSIYVTWGGCKGKKKRWDMGVFILKEKYEKMEVLALQNHIFCYDITSI